MSLYEYKAHLIRVIDGDTVVMQLDLGFNTFSKQILRLVGIDAPEKRGRDLTPEQRQEGLDSAGFLNNLLGSYRGLIVKTENDKTGKYGRFLATIWGVDKDGNEWDISEQMVNHGYATERQ